MQRRNSAEFGLYLVKAPSEKCPLGVVLREGLGADEGVGGFGEAADTAQEIGAGGVEGLIMVELAIGFDTFQQPEACSGGVGHGDGNRSVQLDHGRWGAPR
ncbi:MAG: hypothetical protein HW416_2776 [Chloroflexi bacterium]|nr:hypothetical protein [Chloroflexota bacterium]